MLSVVRLRGLHIKSFMAGITVYKGPDYSIEECRKHLSQYDGGSIELKIDEGNKIATLMINHVPKKNSITGLMMVQLEEAVSKLESWTEGKGLLIHGAEDNFCSGGDLNFAQKTGSPEGGYKMATFMQNVLIRLQQLQLISVAFIDGFALGGGAELAVSCDFRLFSKNASMGFVHARMGIIPAWGGLTTAIHILGYRTALDLITTARVVKTLEAQTIGLCDDIVDSVDEAKLWLAKHVKWDINVLRSIKTVAFNSRVNGNTSASFDFEKRVFSPLWGGPANQQALQSKLKHK